jgi:hypothetical protein
MPPTEWQGVGPGGNSGGIVPPGEQLRKFGIGVFSHGDEGDEKAAAKIVRLIHRSARVARPYFDWRAEQAANGSNINVINRSGELFSRLDFYLDLHESRRKEAKKRAAERIEKPIKHGVLVEFPAFNLRKEALWFGVSAIESFFSWTEHVFIHIAILNGGYSTAADVAKLAKADWGDKL